MANTTGKKFGGRKKGTQNKVSTSTKVWLEDLILRNRKTFETDLKAVKPEIRLNVLTKLLPHVAPKMQNVEAKIDVENLTETQITEIITELKESL